MSFFFYRQSTEMSLICICGKFHVWCYLSYVLIQSGVHMSAPCNTFLVDLHTTMNGKYPIEGRNTFVRMSKIVVKNSQFHSLIVNLFIQTYHWKCGCFLNGVRMMYIID